jgi:hypothetical protein
MAKQPSSRSRTDPLTRSSLMLCSECSGSVSAPALLNTLIKSLYLVGTESNSSTKAAVVLDSLSGELHLPAAVIGRVA